MDLDIKSKDEIKSLTYTIENIVVKTSLNIEGKLDLNKIRDKLIDTEYNPERFPGLFIRFKHPKCVFIIFRNSKIIMTGLKSFEHVNLSLMRLSMKLHENCGIYINTSLIIPEIVNIVITADFFRKINLDLAATVLENTIFEPEVFPGLTFKLNNPIKSVFLIFSNGKIVLTGIREEKLIEPALKTLGWLLNNNDLFIIS
ncbi:MAG: TATA-box-binding protein [Candidatus Hermodarchaeota archaeon]